MKTTIKSFLMMGLLPFTANASDFIPPQSPMNEAEAFQAAEAMLSPQGYRAVHSVSAHFDPKTKSATIIEAWVDVRTREFREELRHVKTADEKNPLMNLDAILAEKSDRGIWKTPQGDLTLSSADQLWKPAVITSSSSAGGVLRKVDKKWFLWASFERGSDGALCCGQSAPAGADDYDSRVKRHAALVKSVDAGNSPHSFKEVGGLLDEYSLAGGNRVVVWRIKNEYLKEWPFALDEGAKQAVKEQAGFMIPRKAMDTFPVPTKGRGYGAVFGAGRTGGVVFQVVENSPAASAGIAAGDRVVSINGIVAVDTGANALQHMNDADTATFVLRRPNGTVYSVTIRKAEWSVMNPKRP